MNTDPGCMNGVYVESKCGETSLGLAVPAPGAYEVRATTCIGELTLRILAPDGGSELAASGADGGTSCPSVQYRFPQGGNYPLRVEKRNPAGCPSVGQAGDIILRVAARP